jgi:hypothetical protein
MPPTFSWAQRSTDPIVLVNKLIGSLVVLVVGLAALAVAGPTLTRLASALVPLILVIGIVVIVLRLTWSYTRKW